MKRLSLLIMTFAMIGAITSCSSLKSIGASDTVAQAAGVSCAKALTNLNASYKANGTISLSNTNDLTNMLTIATTYSQLRNNKDNASYKQAFTAGLISGSNLITSANANNIMNTLLNSTGLNGVNTTNIQSKVETVGTIITLLNALK